MNSGYSSLESNDGAAHTPLTTTDATALAAWIEEMQVLPYLRPPSCTLFLTRVGGIYRAKVSMLPSGI